MKELALRFILGGTIVSVFAALGEVLKPKTFAGLFGSAPSVAIASLALGFATKDLAYVTTECRTMMIGAVALAAYSAACARTVGEDGRLSVWAAAGTCWALWLSVALVGWSVLRFVGIST